MLLNLTSAEDQVQASAKFSPDSKLLRAVAAQGSSSTVARVAARLPT